MKYIIINANETLKPFIFPITEIHSEMAKKLTKSGENIFSAGFVTVTPNGVQCYGRSESLGVASQKIDSKIINKSFIGAITTTHDY